MHNTSLSGFEENRQRSFPSLIRMTRCPQDRRAAKEDRRAAKEVLPVGESNPGLPVTGGDTVHYTNEEQMTSNQH
uniref:Uncharacterized protein n=1 Tax=Knipowitschia caucasica TaxID=637954 RepID=A0AAV2JBS5_KNICA